MIPSFMNQNQATPIKQPRVLDSQAMVEVSPENGSILDKRGGVRSPNLFATPSKHMNLFEDDMPSYNDVLMEDLEPLNPYEDRLTGAIRNIQLRYIGERDT